MGGASRRDQVIAHCSPKSPARHGFFLCTQPPVLAFITPMGDNSRDPPRARRHRYHRILSMSLKLSRLVALALPMVGLLSVGHSNGADGRHWAFVPPGKTPVPTVRDPSWPKTPIDHFILAGLEARDLRAAPPADKRTLIRRATFDLTGLPPKPEEIDAFLGDRSPDAFAKVVDRLLGSPAYGERWGRHWLDVARYADSNGLDENVAYGNAWRYRDYVVAAFNADKPYDQFLVEQIAGDLLATTDEATRHERLIATGFLALGPKV